MEDLHQLQADWDRGGTIARLRARIGLPRTGSAYRAAAPRSVLALAVLAALLAAFGRGGFDG